MSYSEGLSEERNVKTINGECEGAIDKYSFVKIGSSNIQVSQNDLEGGFCLGVSGNASENGKNTYSDGEPIVIKYEGIVYVEMSGVGLIGNKVISNVNGKGIEASASDVEIFGYALQDWTDGMVIPILVNRYYSSAGGGGGLGVIYSDIKNNIDTMDYPRGYLVSGVGSWAFAKFEIPDIIGLSISDVIIRYSTAAPNNNNILVGSNFGKKDESWFEHSFSDILVNLFSDSVLTVREQSLLSLFGDLEAGDGGVCRFTYSDTSPVTDLYISSVKFIYTVS